MYWLEKEVCLVNFKEKVWGASHFGAEYKYLWMIQSDIKYKCLG